MSNKMLEQAIIDAEALKEVALKNAEAAVVEKYSQQIREAVDNLLEQDEEEFEMAGEEIEGLEDQIPLAATDGEKLCPCPEEEEVIEIDLEDLQNMMAAADEDEPLMPEPTPEEVLPEPEEGEEEMTEQSEEDEILEIELEEDEDENLNITLESECGEEEEKQEEGISLKEAKALEKLVAFSDGKAKKVLKENSTLNETNSQIIKENKELKEKQQNILEENKDLKKLIGKLSNTLESVNLSNAKLIYTNQILNSTSLNERQKNKIAEAIADADSVETAKTVFETLRSTVGSNSNDEPKSLSEVVSNNRVSMFRRKEKETSSSPQVERMKKLAGI